MFLGPVLAFLTENAGVIGRYILLPIWFALLLFILLEFFSRKKGVSLSEEFHTKSFTVSAGLILGWLIFIFLPSGIFLPLRHLTLRFVVGVLMLVITVQYLMFVALEFFSVGRTIITLGIGAGIIKSTLAAGIMGKLCADDEGMVFQGATSVMIANAVLVLRNFLIIFIVGAWLGLFIAPPAFFTVTMLVMFLGSAAAAAFFYHKGGTAPADFVIFSPKATLLFMAVFVAFYYLAMFVLKNFGYLSFYVLAMLAGFLYGGAHLFIVASALLLGKISLEAAFLGAVFVTFGSLLSDLPYAFINGARRLTMFLAIATVPTVIVAALVLYYLF